MAKQRKDLYCAKFGNKVTLSRFLERIDREMKAMSLKLEEHLDRPEIVGTCYDGTMVDVAGFMELARENLRYAIEGLK